MRKILSLFLCSCLFFFASCDEYLIKGYPDDEEWGEDTASSVPPEEEIGEELLKTWGKFTYYIIEDRSYIYSYTGNTESPEIPTHFDDVPLAGIHEGAFRDRGAMATLILPDTVTEIGKGAFMGCTALTEITFASLDKLGNDAFRGCSALTSVTGTVKRIGNGAFSGCSSLTALDLSATSQIGEGAFSDCAALTHAPISAVTFIGKSAFSGCTSLASVSLNEKLLRIPESAFQGCSSLTSVSGLTVLEIQQNAFRDCTSLEALTLPDGLTALGRSAFQGCSSLKSINIPEGIAEIEMRVFDGCVSLESVAVPGSLRTVGDSAFGGCTALKDFPFRGITYIGLSSFQDCSSLEKADFSSSLRTIESNAFSGCSSLKNVILPENLKVLGDGAFKHCVSLEYMVLPVGVPSVPGYIFYGCTSLKQAVILNPEVKSIGVKSFSGCTSLNKVILPESVKFVEQNAFQNCPYLFGVNIPDTAIIFGDYILGEESETILGFTWDKEMTAIVDGGGYVELQPLINREEGHMAFFFEYRSIYRFVEPHMWLTLRRTLPEECPHCTSSLIKPTGTTVFQLMYDVCNKDEPVKSKWICYDEECGEAFELDLNKTVIEPTREEQAQKLLDKIYLAKIEAEKEKTE